MASRNRYDADGKYDAILVTAIAAAAASGPSIIIPGTDFAVMAGIWATTAVAIAEMNDVKWEKKEAAKIMLTVLTSLGAYVGSAKVFLGVVSKIPGIGMLGASIANSLANVVLTIWLAFTLIDLFDQHKGVQRLEDYVEFIIKALKPRTAMAKMSGRTAALIRRQGAVIKARLA